MVANLLLLVPHDYAKNEMHSTGKDPGASFLPDHSLDQSRNSNPGKHRQISGGVLRYLHMKIPKSCGNVRVVPE